MEERLEKIAAAKLKLEALRKQRSPANSVINGHEQPVLVMPTENVNIPIGDQEIMEENGLINEMQTIERERIKQFATLTENNANLSIMLDQKKHECEQYKKKCLELEKLNSTLNNQLNETSFEIESGKILLSDIENYKATISRALGQNKELKDEIIGYSDRLKHQNSLIDKLTLETHELYNNLRSVKHSLSQIKSSVNTSNSCKQSITTQMDNLHSQVLGSIIDIQKNLEQVLSQNKFLAKGKSEFFDGLTPQPSRRQFLSQLKEQTAVYNQAFEQLETRFKRAMNENVDLRERNDRLEHLITLLEGESECIGEYIAIYHAQRNRMKEQSRARDHYIMHVADSQKKTKKALIHLKELLHVPGLFASNNSKNNKTTDSIEVITPNIELLSRTLERIKTFYGHIIEPLIPILDYPFNTYDIDTKNNVVKEENIEDTLCLENGPLHGKDNYLNHIDSNNLFNNVSLNKGEGGGLSSLFFEKGHFSDNVNGTSTFPTFQEYHKAAQRDQNPNCKCCQGRLKTL